MPTFFSTSLNDTKKLAKDLAKTIKGGDIIAFFGGLGMGKTSLIKFIVKEMGNDADVSSPTFAIVNDYGGKPHIYHFDMYRVETWEDLYSTGFFDYINENSVLFIEWSENIENALPQNAIKIKISQGKEPNERIFKYDERE